jgi:hypothetical protein
MRQKAHTAKEGWEGLRENITTYHDFNNPSFQRWNPSVATSPLDHTAPDIAFRIFRQPFSRQTSAIIREDCTIVPMWEYETHQVR